MIDIVLMRKGNTYIPFSEEDRKAGHAYPEHQALRAKITGSKKERAYRELCCYFSSCNFIADLSPSSDLNTKSKVDYLTRIRLGFVEDTVFDDNTGLLHWIPLRLSYANCEQKDAHDFIHMALEFHADIAGVEDVEVYIQNLGGL